jgi:hypothetical protein
MSSVSAFVHEEDKKNGRSIGYPNGRLYLHSLLFIMFIISHQQQREQQQKSL